jgi:hypothetical protein
MAAAKLIANIAIGSFFMSFFLVVFIEDPLPYLFWRSQVGKINRTRYSPDQVLQLLRIIPVELEQKGSQLSIVETTILPRWKLPSVAAERHRDAQHEVPAAGDGRLFTPILSIMSASFRPDSVSPAMLLMPVR